MIDDRLRQLEERLVQLEDLVDQLNTVVTRQADQIDFLRAASQEREGSEHPIGPHNDPPPHY